MNRWVAPLGLLGVVAVLVVSGRALPPPSPGALGPWLEQVGPVVAAVSLLRLVALGCAVLLAVASAARVLADAAGAVRVVATLDRALPVPVRRALGAVAGVGAAGSVLLGPGIGPGPSAASVAGEPVATATLVQVPTAALRVADPAPTDGPGPAPATEASMQVVPEAAAASADVPAEVDEWVVAPGESFWSIAEEVVVERLGRPATEGEVAGYWARLVEANRDRLVTADPDLVYPGQRFTLVA